MINIFPDLDINNDNESTKTPSKIGRCFLFDFESGTYKLEDGKLVECSVKESIEQWIKLLILTKRDKYKVYKGKKFGLLDLYNLRGHKIVSNNYMQGEIKRELYESIITHAFIKDIRDISLSFKDESMIIKLSIILEDNTTFESEVSA